MAEKGDGARTMKEIIESDYECVFSWRLQERTGEKQNVLMNFLDTIREKCDSVISEKDVFHMTRFYYQLIIVYELYVLGDLNKSLQEIESIVQLIDLNEFDETNRQYLAAYKHIAGSTLAYIALSMNCYSPKMIENVKPYNILNRAEKSAIYAVKSCVFMEYPPNGNAIALQLADEARNFYSNEPQWICIWLKAKGRMRRFNSIGKSMPDKYEIEAADELSSQTNPKPQFLINACKIYHDMAVFYRMTNNREKSQMFFKLGFDLLIDASKLIKDDIKDLVSCLFTFLFAPKEFQSKTAMYKMVEKLKNVNNNSSVNDVLGEYYLKHEMDYEKAKMYFSRGMFSGQFRSAMQLLKVDCLLNSIDSFPYIQTLKMVYEVFPSPKRRLIILTQMLMYYYDKENPKELMFSLKLFLDLKIEDTLKMQYLINAQSFYNLRKEVKYKQFLNVLAEYVNFIKKHYEWNADEKVIVDETCTLFNKISCIRSYGNQFNKNNKTNFHQQCYNWKSEKNQKCSNSNSPSNKTKNNETWRKKQVNSIEPSECNPFIRNVNNRNGKNKSHKNETTKYHRDKLEDNVNESLVKRFNKHLTISKNSSENEEELNKLKNEHGHLNNAYVPNSKIDPLLFKTETNKLNWKNKHHARHCMAQHGIKNNIQE